MRDALGPGTTLCYCTNVHAGTTLEIVRGNLERHALAVRDAVAPQGRLGIGLWLAHEAAAALRRDAEVLDELAAWLAERRLEVVTINGFPHAGFHEHSVKRRVYHPAWDRPERPRYTIDLAWILARLLAEGEAACISTLPLGWRPHLPAERHEACAAALRDVAAALAAVHDRTGREITLALEPEPGCALDTAADVVGFFERHVDEPARRWIGVCHDVCHAAVMFEAQRDVLAAYADAGVRVDKVQVSSAVEVDASADGIAALTAFSEPRYLHQATLADAEHARIAFFEDLPSLHAAGALPETARTCRVHFHVPIFLERVGDARTTQGEIAPAIAAARELHGTRCFEIETYAWPLLPTGTWTEGLAAGIAQELIWLRARVEAEP